MDVTKQNFLEILPELKETIKNAAFFAIDGEFTGLASENNITPYDSPEEYFRKACFNSRKYILIQLGLTAFRLDPKIPGKFLYKSYNFYIYPRSRKNSFECQGESMAFLAQHGFDFNKLFTHGISYCTVAEAEVEKQRLIEKQKERSALHDMVVDSKERCINHIPVTDENKLWLDEIRSRINDFLDSEEKEIIIDNRNAFQRKLIYQLIEAEFYNEISTSIRDIENFKKILVIERKRTLEEEHILEEQKICEENKQLEEMIGITSIMKLISESRKLIIGHNMFLDIIYILRQCFGDIPRDFEEFKHFAHEIFPNLMDTKYLSSIEELKSKINTTVLSYLYETISKQPFVIPEYEAESSSYSYSMETRKDHNAGFDSFMTGLCFLSLTNFLKIEPNDLHETNKLLSNKKNKIFCLKLQDVSYINLIGQEPQPDRDHVFYIKFPSTWKLVDIINLFRDYGSVQVNWIDDVSAFVALHNRNLSKLVDVKALQSLKEITVTTFKSYKALPIPDSPKTSLVFVKPNSKLETTHEHTKRNNKRQNSESIKGGSSKKKSFAENDIWD